ncbi:unnamed protein product [Paramecium pentaurelia]|uniref:Uncharacterized protein n=1 Tax=Paramecium pentaurelia TaxID=43138 RepID=A0A8S1WSV6_9CILI|nr:unnamed protein product [Paramecium pentaurelia]
MAQECCFDSQLTINSDEDDKLIDVLTFPTNFFLFSESSTQSLSNSESANYPITSPGYKFMGKYYSAEYQENNDEIRTFKDLNLVQVGKSVDSQNNKSSNLENSSNQILNQNQQIIIEKKTNSDHFNQRNVQEKQGIRAKDRQRLSLAPRSNKLNEKKMMSNKLNSIIKVSCLKGASNRNSQIRPIFDLFVQRPSNKNVSFQFTMEQIKTMRKNNKSNIFSMTNEKSNKLFLI